MFASILTWIKGVSVRKLILGLASAGAAGSLALSSSVPGSGIGELPVESSAPVITYETIELPETIGYETVERETSALGKGVTDIETKGVDGLVVSYYVVTYADGLETDRKLERKVVTKEPVNEVVLVGTYVAPLPQSSYSSTESTQGDCDENYAGGCVPIVSYDLNCPDVGFTVQVVGYDKHRLDRDGDGWGCESY